MTAGKRAQCTRFHAFPALGDDGARSRKATSLVAGCESWPAPPQPLKAGILAMIRAGGADDRGPTQPRRRFLHCGHPAAAA